MPLEVTGKQKAPTVVFGSLRSTTIATGVDYATTLLEEPGFFLTIFTLPFLPGSETLRGDWIPGNLLGELDQGSGHGP